MKVADVFQQMNNYANIRVVKETNGFRLLKETHRNRIIFEGNIENIISSENYDDIRQDLYKEPVVSLKAYNNTVVIGV